MGNTVATGRTGWSADKALELWRSYVDTGDARLRDRLLLTFAPMVKYIVYRKIREIPPGCEVDEFIDCGLKALIRSIDIYDPQTGATLEQFAWTRIHGAVLEELRRRQSPPASQPRWDLEIRRAKQEFTMLYGRVPTEDEVRDAVGATAQAPAASRAT